MLALYLSTHVVEGGFGALEVLVRKISRFKYAEEEEQS